jgi:hypothetical protein
MPLQTSAHAADRRFRAFTPVRDPRYSGLRSEVNAAPL